METLLTESMVLVSLLLRFYWETSSGSDLLKLRGISAKTVRSWS
jgi:hypothetical protein